MPDGSSEKNFLAIDLGAESGRAVLGHFASGALTVREVHRFANEPVVYGGSQHWDVARLWLEIQRSLEALQDTRLDGIAVDTWAVDYALLADNGQLLENPYHYRDSRTDGMVDAVLEIVPAEFVYATTGIQFMPINTLYQLFAAQRKTPRLLAAADRLIMIPDLFHYWLCGNAACEFTNASTTQMLNPLTRTWAIDLLDRLGLPSHLPGPVVEAGGIIGTVLPQVSSKLAGTPVIACASHDTASAVAAVAVHGNTAFISSGTWSLLGIELQRPVITEQARQLNFTNEGGVAGTTRLLKNVMGLWLLQGCRKSWLGRGKSYNYPELMGSATKARPLAQLVDPDHPRFLRPDCMLTALDSFCEETGQSKPDSVGAYVRMVLESLALKYRRVLSHLENLIDTPIHQIQIIGGGSHNRLLNQFTADATGRRVLAGPAEATALGNIGVQLLATGLTSSLEESRRVIANSFSAKAFEPQDTEKWEKQAERFEEYCGVSYV